MRQIKITVTVQQEGQTRRYGDTEYRYRIEVEGDLSQDKVLRFCRNCLCGGGIAYEEWIASQKDQVYASDKPAATYFNGYYKFSQSIISQDANGVVTKAVYDYSVTIPYCD
jgi:hypothetical protein